MESRHIAKTLRVNKNKSIGNVLILVEGTEDEFDLLEKIFEKILDYNYIEISQNNSIKKEYISKVNKNSKVIVANTDNSNIGSIFDKNYRDRLFPLLEKEYGSSLKNVRTYLIWDRDLNDKNTLISALDTFCSALDNKNYEMNGLLLLSYPCLEVYKLSNFKKRVYTLTYKSSKEAKRSWNIYHNGKTLDFNSNALLLAVENMNAILREFNIKNYDPSNFKKNNKLIFNNEEEIYKNNSYYKALSLISLMLLDLGIIEEIDNDV